MLTEQKDAIYDEFVASGLWSSVRVSNTDSPPVAIDAYAKYSRPDDVRVASYGAGSISVQHAMKYRHSDFPDLAESHRVEFLAGDAPGLTFEVRETPGVSNFVGDDQSGYWRSATLTQL